MMWNKVMKELEGARGMAWDGCHKIYILMDDAAVISTIQLGYGSDEGSAFVTVKDVDSAMDTLTEWWENSCALKFINGDKNDELYPIIRQFGEELHEED